MRILFLCHRIPYPPEKGEKIRAFHQLRALAARHEVDLFTLVDDPRDLAHRETLAGLCHHVSIGRVRPALARARSLPYLLTPTPLTIPYFYSPSLHREVCAAVMQRHYDRVFVYCSAMAPYVDWTTSAFRSAVATRRFTPPLVVTDLVDVDSNKWEQYAAATPFPFSMVYRREARLLRVYERRVCEGSACVLVSTDREAQLARGLAPDARVHVVPIGIDTNHFHREDKPADAPPAVVFTGDMSYLPNREGAVFFAREVMPLIRRELPDARFLIVGRHPDRRVQELGALPNVVVTGWVPDVRPWLAQAAVAVVPLRIAAGIQTKIVEAMACGLPVVATSRAVQGLTAEVAEAIATATTPADFAERVLWLLRHPEFASARGLEGRRRVAANYSWELALRRLLQVVDDPAAAPVEFSNDTAGHERQPADLDPVLPASAIGV